MDNIIWYIMLVITFVLPAYTLISYFLKYKKYKSIDNECNITGVEVIEKVLDKHNISNIYAVEDKSLLLSKYDSKRKSIKLSSHVFHSTSIFSLVISTFLALLHINNKKDNNLLHIFLIIIPIINILCLLGYVCLVISVVIYSLYYIKISVGILFILNIIYIIFTLIINNIIKKIYIELFKNNLITKNEINMVKDMINSLKYRSLSFVYLILFDKIYQLFKRA